MMETNLGNTSSLSGRVLSRPEFIALAAALMSINALAIDIILPGLQQIGSSLGVETENHRQYVISAYFAGMAFALLPYGPAADRFGRRAPMIFGLVIYVAAAFAAAFATSFEMLLALRFLQGVGAASTRVIAVSMVRDKFSGRQMAETMSLIFMVFMVIPVIAPSIGQLMMFIGNWHFIFVSMGIIGAIILFWAIMRMPETLPPHERQPFTLSAIGKAFSAVLTNRLSLLYTLAATAVFGTLFSFINSAQQIYVGIYDLAEWFPILFALVAGFMALSSYLNSRLVERLGMRLLSHMALTGFLLVSIVWLIWSSIETVPITAFVILFAIAMFQFGWIGSNFNSIAMEPMGHIAGSAASVQGFIQTLGGGLLGTLIGQAYDGTTTPLAAGFVALAAIALVLVAIAERGKLYRSSQ